MTKEQANEFLKIVTGRKIKWSDWSAGEHIIPTGEWKATFDIDTYYWQFWAIDEDGEKDWWCVYGGLEVDDFGDKWVFAETFEDYLEMYYAD